MNGDKSILEKFADTIKAAADAIVHPTAGTPMKMPLNESGYAITHLRRTSKAKTKAKAPGKTTARKAAKKRAAKKPAKPAAKRSAARARKPAARTAGNSAKKTKARKSRR